jgi:hypothetical protein
MGTHEITLKDQTLPLQLSLNNSIRTGPHPPPYTQAVPLGAQALSFQTP